MRWVLPGVALALGAIGLSQTAGQTGLFLARVHRDASGETLPYRLFIPKGYDPKQRYPMVIWLHGSGARGSDNRRQISSANRIGSHVWAQPENQRRHPCFVLVPQTDTDWLLPESWEPSGDLRRAVEVIAALQNEFNIDSARLYVAGQSMGGYGTWSVITAYPGLFAAAIPLCGGGDVSRADLIANLPIWAFHGDRDTSVPIEQSRRMIQALSQAGGTPKYTEYKGAGHDIWGRVFRTPELIEWVFSQKRSGEKQ